MKNELRKRLLHVRENIPDRAQKDARIEQAAFALAQGYRRVFAYVSMGSEAATHDLIRRLLADKQVYVPHTLPDKTMHAHRLIKEDFVCDGLGNVQGIGEICDGQADLIFVPLLGFTDGCHRLGYGAGCYDRYFARYPTGYRVGLAYDEQLCSFAPLATDVPLDCILTPENCIRRKI